MIQIVHVFMWFAQVIVAVFCMGMALVVCESSKNPTMEASPEAKEPPAEKGETAAEKDTYKDCVNACGEKLKVCLDHCNDWLMFVCNPRCLLTEHLCNGSCTDS